MPYSQPTVENLRGDIQHYINLSIASSTKQTYSAGEKRDIDFVTMFKQQSLEQCLPATEAILTEFVAFLAKSIKYASIKTYQAAVRHLPMRRGLQLNLPNMQQLQLVLRCIKHSHGDQSRVRSPITIHHLRLFHLMRKRTRHRARLINLSACANKNKLRTNFLILIQMILPKLSYVIVFLWLILRGIQTNKENKLNLFYATTKVLGSPCVYKTCRAKKCVTLLSVRRFVHGLILLQRSSLPLMLVLLANDVEINPGPYHNLSNINIAHLNIRSLKNREHYILAKDIVIKNKLDVFTVSGTWLDSTVSDMEI